MKIRTQKAVVDDKNITYSGRFMKVDDCRARRGYSRDEADEPELEPEV